MRASLLRSLLAALVLGGVVFALTSGGAASGQEYQLPPPPPPPPPPFIDLPKLKPFPVVRIVGVATRRGVRITALTVKAPIGVIIVSRCQGKKHRCPYKERTQQIKKRGSQKTRRVRVNGFERSFRAGVRLRLFMVSSDHTGKFTSFAIRRHTIPHRRDKCVRGFELTPILCP